VWEGEVSGHQKTFSSTVNNSPIHPWQNWSDAMVFSRKKLNHVMWQREAEL